jgi:exodeoxyribonuclease V alpha subunit
MPAGSPICALPPAEATTDFYFLPAETPEQAVALILKVVGERIPARFGLDPIGQVQVLCPMARGGCGSRSLNIELQQLLNPDPTEQVERFGWRFAPGDKVMQVANDYEKEVFNGDVGTWKRSTPMPANSRCDLTAVR